MEFLIWIGKILFGGFFVYMGATHFIKIKLLARFAASKKVPMPTVMVLTSGLFMLIGGIGIILGQFLRTSVLLLVAFLVPSAVKMHDFWRITDPNEKMMQKLLFLRNTALTGAVLLLLRLLP